MSMPLGETGSRDNASTAQPTNHHSETVFFHKGYPQISFKLHKMTSVKLTFSQLTITHLKQISQIHVFAVARQNGNYDHDSLWYNKGLFQNPLPAV